MTTVESTEQPIQNTSHHNALNAGDISHSDHNVFGNQVTINHNNYGPTPAPATQTASDAEIEQGYCEQVIMHYNKLTLTGLPEREAGLNTVSP